MSRLPIDLAVFDLMGTLVKDVGAMEKALSGALDHHGIPYTQSDLKAMRGAGKRDAFQALIERTVGTGKGSDWCRALAQELYVTFKEMLRRGYEQGPTVEIPGATATVRWLRERGVKVAATSAVDRDLTEPLLARLGWAKGFFDCEVATEEVPQGRPAPYMIFLAMMRAGVLDVRRVAAIGDTAIDLQAGMNAGAGWVIGVLSGAHSLATLGATPHTHILNSVADLPQILEPHTNDG